MGIVGTGRCKFDTPCGHSSELEIALGLRLIVLQYTVLGCWIIIHAVSGLEERKGINTWRGTLVIDLIGHAGI